MTQNNTWEERFSMEFPELYSLEQLDSIKNLNASGGNFKAYPFQEKLKQFIRQERETAYKEGLKESIENMQKSDEKWKTLIWCIREDGLRDQREALLREILDGVKLQSEGVPTDKVMVLQDQELKIYIDGRSDALSEVQELIKKKI